MAKMLSSTDVAIAQALASGSLRFVERASRFGGTFVAVEDHVGVITVADDMGEATTLVREIEVRAGV